MGKWTLAHTEALCSEKFHAALAKPLSQSGLKLEEFFEAFDPQDLVVQKLVGALVNDIVLRRKSSNRSSCPANRVNERCAEASSYINNRPTDAHPSFSGIPSYRSRSSTIRARRRNELHGIMGGPSSSEMPWRTSYSSWTTDPEDFIPDRHSPTSIIDPPYGVFRNLNDEQTQPESESSGEYWWRAAMQGHAMGGSGSLPASPTPFMNERSPSPSRGFVPWTSPQPPPRWVNVVPPPDVPREPAETRAPRIVLSEGSGHAANPNRSSALVEGDSGPSEEVATPRSPLYSSAPPPPGAEVAGLELPWSRMLPANVEVFRLDQGAMWARSPSPIPANTLPSSSQRTQRGPTTVTVEDSLW
ncbi:hypothetical protein FRB90_008202, partial [Tulasnella sp. 427]